MRGKQYKWAFCLCPLERHGKAGRSWFGSVSRGGVWFRKVGYGFARWGLVRRSRCGAVRYAVVIYGMLRRSRLGSFRKDSIWRSWVRSGGQGRAAFGGAWRVQVGQGGLGSACLDMIRCGMLRSIKAVWARFGEAGTDEVWRVRSWRSWNGWVGYGLAGSGLTR